jgi:hypothetical protein
VLCALALVAIVGCEGPIVGGFRTERLDFDGLARDVAGGPVRLEVELRPGEARARGVELRAAHHRGDDERIESSVIAPGFVELVTGRSCAGTLALALEGVEVRFHEQTRFADPSGARIECMELVSRIQAYVALGQRPQITALRRPRTTPQQPSDVVFVADELRIDDEDADGDQRPEIELDVAGANLAYCVEAHDAPADCVGALRVLGRIVTLDGSTEMEASDPEPRLEVRFQGLVQAVSTEARWLRLQSGTMLELVEGSDVEWGQGDDVLGSIEDARRSMGLGRLVEAHGSGVVMATDPVRIWVRELELEIERHRTRGEVRDVIELSGDVLDADLSEAFVTLPFETRLRVTEVSSIEGVHDLTTIDDAVRAGRRVRANARVVIEEIRRPLLVTRAERVTFVGSGELE